MAAVVSDRVKPVTARSECRMCQSQKLTKVWSFGSTPLANAYLQPEEAGKKSELTVPLDVYFCRDCYLVQLRDVVSPHTLFDNYLYVSSTSPSFVKHFNGYAEQLITRFGLTESALVVDVGSNDGILLKPLQQAGVRILGIDPAANIAAQANADGIPTVAAFFTPEAAREIKQQYGPAAVIAANNVFAHTDELEGFVQAVKRLLAENGVFVIEVQYLGDLIAKNLFDVVYHEHVCYYALHPLVSFFARQGMEVFEVDRLPVHGGSLRVFIQAAGGKWERSGQVVDLLRAEQKAGLTGLTPYAEFANRVSQNKEKLRGLLDGLKAQGKRIAGYGAPAKATTLMHTLGIDGRILDFIVDDSPLKQGLVMPGNHVPIVAPSRLYDQSIDYCLILAWNFAEPIMANHQRFTQQGGRFIIPAPEPKIV